jgi:hypothetical protein
MINLYVAAYIAYTFNMRIANHVLGYLIILHHPLFHPGEESSIEAEGIQSKSGNCNFGFSRIIRTFFAVPSTA